MFRMHSILRYTLNAFLRCFPLHVIQAAMLSNDSRVGANFRARENENNRSMHILLFS